MSSPSAEDLSDDEMFSIPQQRTLPQQLRSPPSPRPISWTRQFQIYPLENDPSDRILLPPSALEQLLSSAGSQDLPHPLTFRILNLQTNHFTHVGVREFSAPQSQVGVPAWILESLALQPMDLVAITLRQLSKATRVKLRPLEAGYIEDDWKALLESQLRTHATLTKGDILLVRAGPMTEFKFLVDELEPADAVNLIDTDVTTEIEEMSEDNARQTQKERIQATKKRNAEVVDVTIDQTIAGSVSKGEYAYFRLKEWDKEKMLAITLSSEGDVDLLLGASEDWKPKLDMSTWSEMSGDHSKKILIPPTNVEIADATVAIVGVHGYTDTTFEVTIHQPNEMMDVVPERPNAHAPGFVKCQNCLSWVPERTIRLHENFCLRNVYRCPVCNDTMPKSIQSSHWHCEDCSSHGNERESYDKHRSIEHTIRNCTCGQEFQFLPSLAFHRATTCPLKLIKCRFCQTYKEQGDPFTLSAKDLIAGLTPHESDCGSRTIECHICGRRLRIKEMPVHQQIHDNERRSRPTPTNCRNDNCTRSRGDNVLGLCTICFGPLYSPMNDPNYVKLRSRLERKLLTQLISGCGQKHCSNSLYCATAAGHTSSMSEAMKVVKPQVQGMLDENSKFRICVDETVQRKAFLAGMLSSEGVNDIEWCKKAIEEAKGDLGKARIWLEQNARRKDE
jgi:hypothetical protein